MYLKRKSKGFTLIGALVTALVGMILLLGMAGISIRLLRAERVVRAQASLDSLRSSLLTVFQEPNTCAQAFRTNLQPTVFTAGASPTSVDEIFSGNYSVVKEGQTFENGLKIENLELVFLNPIPATPPLSRHLVQLRIDASATGIQGNIESDVPLVLQIETNAVGAIQTCSLNMF